MLKISDVLKQFPQEVLDRYDFSNAQYHGALTRMTGIVCPEHGEFAQYSGQLRKPGGAGCQHCGAQTRADKKRLSRDEVLYKAEEMHGDTYTYDRMQFVGTHTKFTITCRQHGDFDILPVNFLYKGQGCPTCGAAKRGHRLNGEMSARKTADTKIARYAETFVADARKVHGDKYDYSETVYRGRNTKLTINCPKHGKFDQKAYQHLKRQQGCPECSHHRSKGEAQILKFVSAFSPAKTRDRSIIKPLELDIYLPDQQLAIEYCGEYWHAASSPKEEPFARRRHADKLKACEEAGIRLLTIYESEWLERPKVLKRLIRNAMGKARGKLAARKCEVVQVGPQAATAFFEKYHPQGGAGYGSHYGLEYNGKLVACMRFALGINDRGANTNRTWTLSRYATRVSVQGGASRLLKAFIEEHDPEEIKSFSDNRYFDGAMYAALGFELEEVTAPDYSVYHPKTGLLAKTAWQRRAIPARIAELGGKSLVGDFDPATDPRSERDMTYALGAQRMFDCGKKRWVLRRQSAKNSAV